jgi:hypothetical protein
MENFFDALIAHRSNVGWLASKNFQLGIYKLLLVRSRPKSKQNKSNQKKNKQNKQNVD